MFPTHFSITSGRRRRGTAERVFRGICRAAPSGCEKSASCNIILAIDTRWKVEGDKTSFGGKFPIENDQSYTHTHTHAGWLAHESWLCWVPTPVAATRETRLFTFRFVCFSSASKIVEQLSFYALMPAAAVVLKYGLEYVCACVCVLLAVYAGHLPIRGTHYPYFRASRRSGVPRETHGAVLVL